MIDENNPAGRLHKILSDAKRHRDQAKVREVWASVLNVEQDEVAVTKAVVELYSLSNEIQSLIKMNGRLNHQLYLKSFMQINRAFFPLNLSANWSSSKASLTDEALTRLQFCAEELSSFYAENILSDEELSEIIEKIEALFEAVVTSSLSDVLRLTLLEEVERLRSSISMYRIKGAKGLKEALQGTIGAVVANQRELKSEENKNSEVLRRLGELIDRIDLFTSRALKLNKILTKPIQYLLSKVTEIESENSE